MSVEGKKKRGRWLNSSMLKWAREWRGLSLEEVARRMNKTPEQIKAWEEDDETKPTVKQARKLAEIFNRPFVEFFLPAPPKLPEIEAFPDFRMHKNALEPYEEREFEFLQQWVVEQRQSALELYQEIGESPPQINEAFFGTINESPEEKAKSARTMIKFSRRDQFDLKDSEKYLLPSIIRKRLEDFGVLTLRNNELKHFGVRGLCIAEFPLPVIVVNNEAPTAQAFTLAHELGHMILKAEGITGPRTHDYVGIPEERWCDRFAAAFLMPIDMIIQRFGTQPSTPLETISDDSLTAMASAFRVSPHAMLIRLVHLGYVEKNYYWVVKKPQFDEEERDQKQFARSKYYGSRYRSKLGDLYTGLVMEAWAMGKILNHHAAQYMGIKNMKHLYDIRNEYRSS